MEGRTVVYLAAVAFFLAALVTIAVRSYRRAQKSSKPDLERLLNRLNSVDRKSIAEVALDIVDAAGQQRSDQARAALEPEEIWKLVGGLEGLELLEANCEVLIDLAFYLQRWYPEALLVTEQLRLSAREVKWEVERLRSAQTSGKLEIVFAMYAQRATATYYAMTRRLLALYEHGDLAMFAELEKAL